MEQTEGMNRQRELTALLQKASKAYYAGDTEIMSNLEYDALYDELVALEKESGVVLASSPTTQVGYEAVDELPKERHAKKMLSLDKTKDREELANWLQDQKGLLSWKMDGLTIVLTYENGELKKAVTRGNGEVGEVVTGNARVFDNLPLRIPFMGRLILRGEAIIRYSDFEKIKAEAEEYKNPRNLCSGSVRQLNNEITAKRHVRFYAFGLVSAEETETGVLPDFGNSRENELSFLKEQGFETVFFRVVKKDNVVDAVTAFEKEVGKEDIPSDGLVLMLDDIAYGESLGTTAKFPRNAIAFKWQDEQAETTLREVEWSASRTGLINPVAIFDPVELEGTTVKRASIHNISIIKALELGIGDRIRVYKANMIIPQISENLTKSGNLTIPSHCPVCGRETEIRKDNDSEVLFCQNPDCTAKKLKSFVLFVGRNGMNIEGLSEMTLEKFIAEGFVHDYVDLYHLDRFKDRICAMEGFGEKSYENLMESVEKSRDVALSALLYAIGIPGIGASGGRLLSSHFHGDPDLLRTASEEELSEVEGIGSVLASQIRNYFTNEENAKQLDALLSEVRLTGAPQTSTQEQVLSGKTFVITGAVHHFANRDALKDRILSLGGKAAGSVSAKTDYLINNDSLSASSKNKKAKELGIPVITEEEFLSMIGDA